MKSIEQIDKNFLSATGETAVEGNFLPVVPGGLFQVEGLPFWEQDKVFCRLPQAVISRFNENLRELCWHTAGAKIRFRTDSPVVVVRAKLRNEPAMSHMPDTGSSGFDLFCGTGRCRHFIGVARSLGAEKQFSTLLLDVQGRSEEEYPAAACIPGTYMRELSLNFPLYNGVESLEIGLVPGSTVLPPAPYALDKPVLFYGSSITQGGCASRPGNCYSNLLAKWLDIPTVNYGFSGNAKGEPEMAELIASIPMSCFVMDYDHNAPNPQHLRETHYPFYRLIREKWPKLPIIMVTKPDLGGRNSELRERLSIIHANYERGLAEGDKHLFFVNGQDLFGEYCRDCCTVDGCHPNDLGFFRMAEKLEPTLRRALNTREL